MVDNIVMFPGTENTKEEFDSVGVEVSVDDVLEGAKGNGLQDLILVGRNSEGSLFFASTSGSASKILYDLESAKHILMTATFLTEG